MQFYNPALARLLMMDQQMHAQAQPAVLNLASEQSTLLAPADSTSPAAEGQPHSSAGGPAATEHVRGLYLGSSALLGGSSSSSSSFKNGGLGSLFASSLVGPGGQRLSARTSWPQPRSANLPSRQARMTGLEGWCAQVGG